MSQGVLVEPLGVAVLSEWIQVRLNGCRKRIPNYWRRMPEDTANKHFIVCCELWYGRTIVVFCAVINKTLAFAFDDNSAKCNVIMAALRRRCGHYIFVLFLLFFFPCLISAVTDWMSTILLHMVWPLCEFRMQVWKVLHAARLAGNAGPK